MGEKKKNINELACEAFVALNHCQSWSVGIKPLPPGFQEGFEAGVKYLRDRREIIVLKTGTIEKHARPASRTEDLK